MTYPYLKKFCSATARRSKAKAGKSQIKFFPVLQRDIDDAERLIKKTFPREIREFYLEIGHGSLAATVDKPGRVNGFYENRILGPKEVSNICSQGGIAFGGPALGENDLPIFAVADGDYFIVRTDESGCPIRMRGKRGKIIEEYFAKFIHNLAHISEEYYIRKMKGLDIRGNLETERESLSPNDKTKNFRYPYLHQFKFKSMKEKLRHKSLKRSQIYFFPVTADDIIDAQKIMGRKLPEPIVQFLLEIGTGVVRQSIKNKLKPYTGVDSHGFFGPETMAELCKSSRWAQGGPPLGKNQLPFFDAPGFSYYVVHFDDSKCAIRERGDGKTVVEESLERFIYNMAHHGPAYYGRRRN
jgi:hypothetical protein